MAWNKSGSETLATSTVNGITITPSSASIFNQYMIHSMVDSNSKPPTLKLSGTSTSVAYRKSDNGASDPTPSTGEPDVRLGDGTSDMQGFNVGYVCNIAGQEKLGINHYANAVGIGAGSAPARSERVFKDATTAQFTSLRFRMHTGASNVVAGSNFTVLGSDGVSTPAPNNVQDNSIFVEKDTAKRYWFDEAVPYTDEDITWDSTTAVNVSISGNTATATGSTAWDKASQSTQTWTPSDEPTLEFTVTGSPLNQMVGFGQGTLGSSYTTLDFGLYTEAGLGVYESGVQKYNNTSVTPSSSDTFKVTMDSNGLVKYWRNGSVFYTSLQTASGTYYAQFTPKTSASTTTVNYSSTTPATWTREIPSFTGSYFMSGGTAGPWTPVNYHDQFNGTTWATASNLPTAVSLNAGTGTKEDGASFGGDTSGTATPVNNNQSWTGSSWSASQAMNTTRNQTTGGGATGSTSGWVAGGRVTSSGNPVNTSEQWNGTSWSTGGNMSGVRRNSAGSGIVTEAWNAGGYTGSVQLDTMELYNGTSWSAGSNIHSVTDGLTQGGGDSYNCYYVGGNEASGTLDHTHIYNGTAWSLGNPLTFTVKYNATMGTPQDAITACGFQPNGSGWAGVWSATFNGTSWTSITNVTRGRGTGAGGT